MTRKNADVRHGSLVFNEKREAGLKPKPCPRQTQRTYHYTKIPTGCSLLEIEFKAKRSPLFREKKQKIEAGLKPKTCP